MYPASAMKTTASLGRSYPRVKSKSVSTCLRARRVVRFEDIACSLTWSGMDNVRSCSSRHATEIVVSLSGFSSSCLRAVLAVKFCRPFNSMVARMIISAGYTLGVYSFFLLFSLLLFNPPVDFFSLTHIVMPLST